MKRYLFLFLIVTIYGCREQANRPARTSTRTGVASYSNPLLTSGADPYAIYHDGVYYYTQSMYDHLSIWKTKDITDLRHARSKTVWLPDDLTNSRDLWAPELHYLDGKWYLYYAAAGIRAGSHQLYVLENSRRPVYLQRSAPHFRRPKLGGRCFGIHPQGFTLPSMVRYPRTTDSLYFQLHLQCPSRKSLNTGHPAGYDRYSRSKMGTS